MNTRDGKCKWNEKGFSLVELIIVIAIMAVVIGTVVFSVSMVFSANAKTCCNNLQRAIADCKVTTMGKSEAWLVLYRGSDNQIYCQMYYNEAVIENDAEGNPKVKKNDDGNVIMKAVPANEEPQKIGGKRVVVTYIDTDEKGNEKNIRTFQPMQMMSIKDLPLHLIVLQVLLKMHRRAWRLLVEIGIII